MLKLTIDFPLYVLDGYNGGVSNLDATLDDNITYYIGRHFYDCEIQFSVKSLNTMQAVPNKNDELVRYVVVIDSCDSETCAKHMVEELTKEGYARGCTIKTAEGSVLHADAFTPDIQLRRVIRRNAKQQDDARESPN